MAIASVVIPAAYVAGKKLGYYLAEKGFVKEADFSGWKTSREEIEDPEPQMLILEDK